MANDLRRGAEKFSETGKILRSHFSTPEGVGLPRTILSHVYQKESMEGELRDYY